MARAVMPAIFSRRPRKSASSSSISFSIMVDSMSATSRRLRRLAVGTTTASMPGNDGVAALPSNGSSQATPGASQSGVPTEPPLLHSSSAARCTILSSSRGCARLEIRTRVFFTLRL